MTRVLALGVVVTALAASPTAAQRMRGLVVEAGTEMRIPGALVEALRPDGTIAASIRADSLAAFVLPLPVAGRYLLRLTHPSYRTVADLSIWLAAGESVDVALRMSRDAVPLSPLLVRSRGNARLASFYERVGTPGGQYVTRTEIDLRPAARATDLLREMHGVEIVTTGGGASRPRVTIIALRGGGGRCLPTLYLDGIIVRQLPESGLDDFLRPSMIEGIEVYSGAASAPSALSSRDGCGVVGIWTRPVRDVEHLNRARIIGGGVVVGALTLLILVTR